MVKTRIIDENGFEKLPAGMNVTLAVMSYSGYDIEDAAIHNKSAIERSYARCMVMKKQCVPIKRYSPEVCAAGLHRDRRGGGLRSAVFRNFPQFSAISRNFPPFFSACPSIPLIRP